jgi:hypothetical protein
VKDSFTASHAGKDSLAASHAGKESLTDSGQAPGSRENRMGGRVPRAADSAG